MAKFNKYVYVVSVNDGKVIDTAPSTEALKKRIASKKTPYPENTVFVKVDITSPLTSLKTDEQIGCDILTNALLSAAVADVSYEDARNRLQKAEIILFVEAE